MKRAKPLLKEKDVMTAGRILLGLIIALFIYYQFKTSPGLLGSTQGRVLLTVTLAYLAYTLAPTTLITKFFSVVCAIAGAYLISDNNLKFGVLLIAMGVLSFWSILDGVKERE